MTKMTQSQEEIELEYSRPQWKASADALMQQTSKPNIFK